MDVNFDGLRRNIAFHYNSVIHEVEYGACSDELAESLMDLRGAIWVLLNITGEEKDIKEIDINLAVPPGCELDEEDE